MVPQLLPLVLMICVASGWVSSIAGIFWQVKPKYSEKSLSQLHIVHQKSHMHQPEVKLATIYSMRMKAQNAVEVHINPSLTSVLDGNTPQRHAPLVSSPGKDTRNPLYRNLDRLRGRSGRVQKISSQRNSNPGLSSSQQVAKPTTMCVCVCVCVYIYIYIYIYKHV